MIRRTTTRPAAIRRPSARFLARGAALALLLAASPALADPVFPGASRVGLEPLAGMAPAARFQGFQDPATGASIVLVEMPAAAYAEMSRGMTDAALAGQGIKVAGRGQVEGLALPHVFVAGTQETPSVRVGKWVLVAQGPDLTALVTVQVPVTAAATHGEAAVRRALATLALRAEPGPAASLAALPFRLGDLAGFRVVRTFAGSGALLTEGPLDGINGAAHPVAIVAASIGRAPRPDEYETFGRRGITELAGVKAPVIEQDEVVTRGGATWSEIVASASDATTGEAIVVTQSIRFGDDGYLRVIGIGRAGERDALLPRFARLRDGLAPR